MSNKIRSLIEDSKDKKAEKMSRGISWRDKKEKPKNCLDCGKPLKDPEKSHYCEECHYVSEQLTTEVMTGYRPGDICFYCDHVDVNIQGEERKIYPNDPELTRMLGPRPTVMCKKYDQMVFRNHRCNGYSDL